MADREKQRHQAVGRLASHLLRTGLSATSLRQLAAAAGVSDRMLLYYFADKADALSAAMGKIAGDLGARLDSAIPPDAALGPAAFIARATALTTGREVKPYMSLWIEVVAAAARREPPFVEIAQAIAAGFLEWIETRLEDGPKRTRRATAAMILAMIDGLALLEVCAGPGLTGRAAATMTTIALP